MNLKESFRYQKFLDRVFAEALASIQQTDHCLSTTKKHLHSKIDSNLKDVVEVSECDYHKNDDVLKFLQWAVEERRELTEEINRTKNNISVKLGGIDIDAAIEQNKFSQRAVNSINIMLQNMPRKRIESGKGYKFNVEGNQTSYCYDILVETRDSYDRESANSIMKQMIKQADLQSSKIDNFMINSVVDYIAIFDVNDSFDDVMKHFE